MEEIKVLPKPDWVSYDDIHELLEKAHQKNYKKGIVLQYSKMTGDEIKKKLGDEGQCWVAMDGNKLVGTTSVTFFQGKNWWNEGKKVAHGCFTGILNQYQGIGILEELNAMKYEYTIAHGADMNQGDTAENNYTVLKVLGKEGYKVVGFCTFKNSNHYSVRIVKWLKQCPFSDEYINRRCKWSERMVKLQYKPGKIERSKIISFFCICIRKVFKIE